MEDEIEKKIENLQKMAEEMEQKITAKEQERLDKKEAFKNLIDLALKLKPDDYKMMALKYRIAIDESLDNILDSTTTNETGKNEKIVKFFMELDALTKQFIDCTGLEIKNDNQ